MQLLKFLLIFLVITSCSSGEQNKENDLFAKTDSIPSNPESFNYSLLFGTVDSQARVYVNEQEIPNLDLKNKKNESTRVGLDAYLRNGKNTIKVELYNGVGNLAFDKRWEIYYELYRGIEPIDFAHEKSGNGEQGLVFEMTHEITVELSTIQ